MWRCENSQDVGLEAATHLKSCLLYTSVLDGAHNPDGARALAATLRGAGLSGLTAVIGILDGKQMCIRDRS